MTKPTEVSFDLMHDADGTWAVDVKAGGKSYGLVTDLSSLADAALYIERWCAGRGYTVDRAFTIKAAIRQVEPPSCICPPDYCYCMEPGGESCAVCEALDKEAPCPNYDEGSYDVLNLGRT